MSTVKGTATKSKEEELKALFDKIVDTADIRTVFQPIVSLRDGSIFGYEALSRGPKDTEMENPEILFTYARKYGKLWELELICRSKALEAVSYSHVQIKLLLNVNPNIIHEKKFRQGFTKEYLSKYSLDPENIIFEITEREAIKNNQAFIKTVQNYKEQNYTIAIDDVGAGYSGLNLISEIRPHYIKLDMNLIRDVDKDATKRSLIKCMCDFATLSNTGIVAEGIETENELEKLIELGVHYGQGYYIQRPNSSILPIQNKVLSKINEFNARKNHIFGSRISDIYINNICKTLPALNVRMKIAQVKAMIDKDPNIPGYCITEEEVLLGVITRNDLNARLSGPYGYSLYANKPISEIMSKRFMRVDYSMSIEQVAKIAMQREQDKLYDFVAITQNDKYLGIITVKDLLEKTIQIEIINAKHINPLSELPGNLLIEKHLEMCISNGNHYCVLYLDIDNFKAYNDVYGFEKGDYVIKRVTYILKRYIPKDAFIGHIGGDDFVAIIHNCEIEELCNNVIAEFDLSVGSFYTENDLAKGYIIAKNRHGTEESFPILSLSIAGITNRHFQNIYDLSQKASELKKICKQKAGSNFLII